MFRYLAILFLVCGFSYQAMAVETHASYSLKVESNQPNDNNNPVYRIMVAVKDDSNNTYTDSKAKIGISVACGSTTVTKEHKLVPQDDKGEAHFDIAASELVEGHTCTATATASETGGDTYETGTADFDVCVFTFPAHEVVGQSITAGKEFKIGNIVVGVDLPQYPFFDLVLRECTAGTDPWIFWHKTGTNTALHRVYPTSTNSNNMLMVSDKDASNDNTCKGRLDGEIDHLFTIGNDHGGCQVKLVKEDVTGGDSFTEQGAPALATGAAVTLSGDNIMLHTGAKPATPANIEDTIQVYISTNRGFSWGEKSAITAWTSQATDSGFDVAAGNTDNTRNMAMIRITDGTSVWWRIIKGE